ncbi:hypothetical protein AgCh_008014 [Apium graveolens]
MILGFVLTTFFSVKEVDLAIVADLGTLQRLPRVVGYVNAQGNDKGLQLPLPFSFKVPRKKRSVLPQYCLTSTGRLHLQLLQVLREQECSSAKTPSEEGNDLVIDNSRMMMSSNETALDVFAGLFYYR